jgi:Transposase IS66 family
MPSATASLPSDPQALRALAASLQDALAAKERELAARDAEIHAKTLHIEKLRATLALMKRARFGQSSERLEPIERGRPGPSLLAHVLVAKYCDHAPLYRQSAIYARAGVELERSTLADWVGQAPPRSCGAARAHARRDLQLVPGAAGSERHRRAPPAAPGRAKRPWPGTL